MKKNSILSEVEISSEELRCLDAHFRQIQREAVVRTLRQPAAESVVLLGKIVARFCSADQLQSVESKD